MMYKELLYGVTHLKVNFIFFGRYRPISKYIGNIASGFEVPNTIISVDIRADVSDKVDIVILILKTICRDTRYRY